MFLCKERAPTNSCGVATLSQNSQKNKCVIQDAVWFSVVYARMVEWIGCIGCHTSFVATKFDTRVHPMEATPRRFAYMAVLLSNDIRVVLFVNPANGDS